MNVNKKIRAVVVLAIILGVAIGLSLYVVFLYKQIKVELTNDGQTAVFSSATPAIKSEMEAGNFLVTRVVDGDTIELENGQKVRYIGVNTPEINDNRKTVECFGKEAANKNTDLVLGKRVRLEKDVSDKDKYGRLLRYVYAGNIFVNDYLVREGYAKVSTYPPDVKYSEQFSAAERKARDNFRGLWEACPAKK